MLIVAFILFLSSCASEADYNQSLENWVGMSQEALYHEWGLPQNEIYVTPTTKVVTYIQTENAPIDGNTQPYAGEVAYQAIETPDYGADADSEEGNYYCKTSFTIENNEVVNFTFNGDDCVNN